MVLLHIIVGPPNALLATLHDRMPVITSPEDYDAWINARTEAEARSLLQPFDPEVMVAVADPRPKRG